LGDGDQPEIQVAGALGLLDDPFAGGAVAQELPQPPIVR
jgi:hypothetical protein